MLFCLFGQLIFIIDSRLVCPFFIFKSLKRIYNPLAIFMRIEVHFHRGKIMSVFVAVKAHLFTYIKENYHIFYGISNNYIYYYVI